MTQIEDVIKDLGDIKQAVDALVAKQASAQAGIDTAFAVAESIKAALTPSAPVVVPPAPAVE